MSAGLAAGRCLWLFAPACLEINPFHGFNQQHTQTSITFHVGCTGIALQGYAPSLFTSSSLPPPNQSQPRHKADHSSARVLCLALGWPGRPCPWLGVADPTLCNSALIHRHTCQPRAFATIYFSRTMGEPVIRQPFRHALSPAYLARQPAPLPFAAPPCAPRAGPLLC